MLWVLRRSKYKGLIIVKKTSSLLSSVLGLILTYSCGSTQAVTFNDIAPDEGSGLNFKRLESPREEIQDLIEQQPLFSVFDDFPLTPILARGTPGVVIFDADGDGDEDIYVTNGPGRANSLFINQIQQTGVLAFVDSALEFGVAAQAQDSSGACSGDLDNDGDLDLLVLGVGEPSILFENTGSAGFVDITQSSNLGESHLFSSSCAMGDINNDGLLDIAIANTYTNWENHFGVVVFPFELSEHNQLFQNIGDNTFNDISANSGFEELTGFISEYQGSAGVTWSLNLVDYDSDGDLDAVFVDDQAGIVPARDGGVDRGLIHIMENDGSGLFTDVNTSVGLSKFGAHRGITSGDFNCDGHLDLFATNAGDYSGQLLTRGGYQPGDFSSRWFFGADTGVFSDPGVGDLQGTVFGWSAAVGDIDNDADPDIIYHGGLEISAFVLTNPGVILENQGCSGQFTRNTTAASSTDHTLRVVLGMALGDLNNDGFIDIVSASNANLPETMPVSEFPALYGGPFDDAVFALNFFPTDEVGIFTWSGFEFSDGDLSVEINSADNANNWLKVDLLGGKGIISEGTVNRNGIGSVVSMSLAQGTVNTQPIMAGSSTMSQSSITAIFGMGNSSSDAMIDILWPGGIKNRVYDVQAKSDLLLPEIPCSYDDLTISRRDYYLCVRDSLEEYRLKGFINRRMERKLFFSALRARRTATIQQ